MQGKKNIEENKLDELLREYYLAQNSISENEKEAGFVLAQDYPVSIDPLKEKALLAKLQQESGSGGFKFYPFVYTIIVLLLLLIICFNIGKRNGSQGKTGSPLISAPNFNAAGNEGVAPAINVLGPDKEIVVAINDTFGRAKTTYPVFTHDTLPPNNKEQIIPVAEIRQRTVPLLTAEDKVKYSSIKKQMIVKLLKKDKGLYTHLPAFKTTYAGKEIIVDAFTLRNISITNLEYKTFLADLLAQNRNEDYLLADVLNENWRKMGYNNLAGNYYSEEKYNDFPVVNITLEGAKLFCKWLQEEIKSYAVQTRIKAPALEIRLPYDYEWIYAAWEGYAKIAFEKGYNTIYDESEGLVNASFTDRVELIKRRVKKVDTLYNVFTTNRYGWKEKDILNFFDRGFTYFTNAPYDTIYTDRMKVLGKIGRVSEMVPQKDAQRIWLSGLSWKSKEEYLTLLNEFKTQNSSPFAGFRIAVINPKDAEYKNPFW